MIDHRFWLGIGIVWASGGTLGAQQPLVVRGVPAQAVIGSAASAVKVTQLPPGETIAEMVDVSAGNMVVASSSVPAQATSAEATPQLVDLLTAQPFQRRASDVIRGSLVGEGLLAADSSSAGASPRSTAVRPPRLQIPSPQSYDAFVAAAKVRDVERQAARVRVAVTLGDWPYLAQQLSQMPPADAERIFDHLLLSLTQPILSAAGPANANPLRAQPQSAGSEIPAPQYVTAEDVLALADLAPQAPNDMQLAQLANLLQQARTQGFAVEPLVAKLQSGTRWLGGQPLEHRVRAARLLTQVGLHEQAAQLLPAFAQLDRSNPALLQTYAELAQTQFAQDRKQLHLEQAWSCYLAILELASASLAERSQALERLIQLSTKIDKPTGEGWLATGLRPAEGQQGTILATLGARTLDGPQHNPNNPQERLEWLQLQRVIVERVLAETGTNTAALVGPLSLLGSAWLREAELALNLAQYSSGSSYMQVDMYGNYYWVDPNQDVRMAQQQQGAPQPIALHELIACRPSEAWIAGVAPDLQLAFPKMLIRLHLQADEEDQAFPYIEHVAAREPAATQALVDEFLQTWTRNHDPNSERRMQNRYIYFYGFEQRADSIPLTRSKQERNILDLAQWVERIRRLPLPELDETQLAQAFTTCHSSAEVFKLAAIEQVFGPIERLKPETIAALVGTMRGNLATVWRTVREQEAKQTNRREPQIQQEVIRGYEVAREVVDRALQAAPQNWQLLLAAACLAHDENDYRQSIAKSSEYSEKRGAILARFAEAAAQYGTVVGQLAADKQSTEVYDYWFYASLGAVDLGRITAETVPAQRQFALIRQALDNLPREIAADHLGKFANNLFTRMSPLKPELKYRYLKGGFEIVGDHPRAIEARKLFQYYNDLIQEIQLVAQIDGSDVVGHTQPFGVYLNIRHTAEIERESAGFAKYVQNQNAQQFAYNYGRPTEDYRDKFEKNVREALGEHFDVLSVAFEDPKSMRSREDAQPGWRVTPYAYVVLKPLGPQVDKLPAVQLDLDFLDTSGYAVIPVHSAIVPIDAAPSQVPPRPCTQLTLTQTLDERQAADGKLILEIKGTGQGLVPNLAELLDLQVPGFAVDSIDEQPVLPSGFDPKSETIVINSDRSWTVVYKPNDNEAGGSREFRFPPVKPADCTSVLQRYADADLVPAEPLVSLERSYRAPSSAPWLWGVLAVLAVGFAAVVWRLTRRAETGSDHGADWAVPQEVNPFTVLSLLQRIRDESPLGQRHRPELDQSIADLQQYYFGPTNGQPTPDLPNIARTWSNRVLQQHRAR